MTVYAYNPKTGEPLLLRDDEAAAKYASGEATFAAEDTIPVRGPDGVIRGYPAAQVPALLQQPNHQIDFVEGNAQRAARLRQELPARMAAETFGPAAPAAVALATGASDTATLGLADAALRQTERTRASNSLDAPNPGLIQHFRDRGYSFQDALLLAEESRVRPTQFESLSETNPVASGAGNVLGVVGPAVATGGLSVAAEAPIAAAGLSALGRAGVTGVGARIASRAGAGALVAAGETALQVGVQRVGEGIIEERLPQFTAEDALLVGGAGILGLGFNALGAAGGEAIGGVRNALARRAAEGVEQAAVMTQLPAIERLTGDIAGSFDPGNSVNAAERFLIQANQAIGSVDPSRNRRLMNPRFIDLAGTPDDVFQGSAARVADGLGNIDGAVRNAELEAAQASRRQFAEMAAGHIRGLDDAGVVNLANRLRDYGERFAVGTAFDGLQQLSGRTGQIVNAIRRVGQDIAANAPDRALLDQAEALLRRPAAGDALTATIPGTVVPQIREQLEKLAVRIPNLQAELAKVSRGVASGEEADLANEALRALQSLDSLAADPAMFGQAGQALQNVRTFRNLQSARNQMLKAFGIAVADDTDRVVKEIGSARLAQMAEAASDNASVAQRRTVANYLAAALAVDEVAAASGGASFKQALGEVEDDLFHNVLEVGAARAELQILRDQGNKGGWLRGMGAGTAGAVVGSLMGGPVGAAGGAAIGVGAALAMRPDRRVMAVYQARRAARWLVDSKLTAVRNVVRRLDMPKVNLDVPAKVVRSIIIPNPALYDPKTRDAEFDKLVSAVQEMSDNPMLVATKAEQAGVAINESIGADTVTGLTMAMQHLRSQMPDSLFEPLNPTPPARRVSGMVRHNVIRTVEAIHNPLSIYDDFSAGMVSATKVNTVKTVFPQLYREMNAHILQEYSDRVAQGVRMPYATRMNISVLLGTPIESALRQQNLQLFQTSYAQTSAQADAQGMGRQPARAVTSLTSSTTTEGTSLQDSQ